MTWGYSMLYDAYYGHYRAAIRPYVLVAGEKPEVEPKRFLVVVEDRYGWKKLQTHDTAEDANCAAFMLGVSEDATYKLVAIIDLSTGKHRPFSVVYHPTLRVGPA